MRRRLLGALAAAGLLGALPAGAIDAPHGNVVTCKSCHVAHKAPGGALTSTFGNANLCFSCHNQTGVGVWRGWPWTAQDAAIPGLGGKSHRWDGSAVSPSHGARVPNGDMPLDGEKNVTCSTCHDQHDGATNNALGSPQHLFSPDGKLGVGSVLVRSSGSGTGTVTITSVVAPTTTRMGARPRDYWLQISTGGAAGTATYVVSYDNGRTWSAAASTTSPVTLDADAIGPTVQVTFAGSFASSPADAWKRFTVSYPMLRVSNLNGAMCEDCHRERVMTGSCVEGSSAATNGAGESCDPSAGISYNHPTGAGAQLLKPYDRATGGVPAVLDVNGVVQGGAGGDPLTTNKLVFDSSNQVRCLTCHNTHNADSNSLTEDVR